MLMRYKRANKETDSIGFCAPAAIAWPESPTVSTTFSGIPKPIRTSLQIFPQMICRANASASSICLRRFGLPEEPERPIIAIISRLVGQKGYDLIRQLSDSILETGSFFIALGAGAKEYEEFLQWWHDAAPKRVGIYKGYAGEPLAHQIEAGADMFLMPSLTNRAV